MDICGSCGLEVVDGKNRKMLHGKHYHHDCEVAKAEEVAKEKPVSKKKPVAKGKVLSNKETCSDERAWIWK